MSEEDNPALQPEHLKYIVGFVILREEGFVRASHSRFGGPFRGWTRLFREAYVFSEVTVYEALELPELAGAKQHPVILEHRGAMGGLVGERNQYRTRAKQAEEVIDLVSVMLDDAGSARGLSEATYKEVLKLLRKNQDEYIPVPPDPFEPP